MGRLPWDRQAHSVELPGAFDFLLGLIDAHFAEREGMGLAVVTVCPSL